MSEDPYAKRKSMTFAQAEGVEPLPEQLALKIVSPQMRAQLWALVFQSLENAIDASSWDGPPRLRKPWSTILSIKHVEIDDKFADDFRNEAKPLIAQVKRIFADGTYVEIFGFLQWLLQNFSNSPVKARDIQRVLVACHAPYRVIDEQIIVPITTEAETASVERAFSDLSSTEFNGAKAHLRTAGKLLSNGSYADSIRESIHAVEAVACVILNQPKATLGEALKAIERTHNLHPSLREGFSKFYGWTNAERGIRHSLIDDANANVDEYDAIYMFGACGAFVSYLIARYRKLKPKDATP